MAETGAEAMKELSFEVAEEVETFYYAFFAELYRIISQGNNETPSRFANNMGEGGGWKPLSDAWSDRKRYGGAQSEFYFGLTAVANKARRKSVSAARRKGKNVGPSRDRKSFIKFLSQHAGMSPASVLKFFGPVQINYKIDARGRKTPIKMEQIGNVITELERITARDEKGRFVPTFGNVTLEANMEMFTMLRGAMDFSEWYVVDMLAKKDASNRKQWAKINSRKGIRGSVRPIRAMITPLISWYATTGLTQALRKFYV